MSFLSSCEQQWVVVLDLHLGWDASQVRLLEIQLEEILTRALFQTGSSCLLRADEKEE